MHCSRVTLLTGAQNHTVVLNVERDRVHEATFEGIDRENITIHACSDQDLLVLQATPLEVRVIQTLGASASGSSKLLESWTPSCILSSDDACSDFTRYNCWVKCSHCTSSRQPSGAECLKMGFDWYKVNLRCNSFPAASTYPACLSADGINIHPRSLLRSGFSAKSPEDSSFPSTSCRFLQSLLGFRNATLGLYTLL